MKKLKIMSLLMLIVTILFGGMMISNAGSAKTLPDSVVSDPIREVEYIENFPVIVKSVNNGQYYVYCLNMSATYGGNITFNKTGKVDDGFVYILNHIPNTGDKDKDFYITQMAVWYYEDYLTQTNFNLVAEVKKYILRHKDTEDVSKQIYALYDGAKNYVAPVGKLALGKDAITFTEVDGYFVSSEIALVQENLDSAIRYNLSNAPVGSKIVKSTNGVKVKIPVDKIPEGKQMTITMSVAADYNKYTPYYYFQSDKYQRVLFQNALVEPISLSDSVQMVVKNAYDKVDVKIRKTDITKSKEVEGATLVIKDEAGNIVDSWVSTTEAHHSSLAPGKYSLTETIAPKGYKLSSTTIEFKVSENGTIGVKNEKGEYILADEVVMVNEVAPLKVKISKTDVTKSKEIPGANLVVKDENGKEIAAWTSTSDAYYIELYPGKYTLTETLAPKGYKLSKTSVEFMVTLGEGLFVKNDAGTYVVADRVVMVNELYDVVSFAKKDKATDALLAGAKMVIKDEKGNIVKEFTSTNQLYQLSLGAGKYTLTEIEAPKGYVLSNVVVAFELLEDGTLKIQDANGKYNDAVYVTFYNNKAKEQEVIVPNTDLNSNILTISGLLLLVSGAFYVKKAIKKC